MGRCQLQVGVSNAVFCAETKNLCLCLWFSEACSARVYAPVPANHDESVACRFVGPCSLVECAFLNIQTTVSCLEANLVGRKKGPRYRLLDATVESCHRVQICLWEQLNCGLVSVSPMSICYRITSDVCLRTTANFGIVTRKYLHFKSPLTSISD